MSKENKHNHTVLRRITKVRPRHWIELKTAKGLAIKHRLKGRSQQYAPYISMMPRNFLSSVYEDDPILYSRFQLQICVSKQLWSAQKGQKKNDVDNRKKMLMILTFISV